MLFLSPVVDPLVHEITGKAGSTAEGLFYEWPPSG